MFILRKFQRNVESDLSILYSHQQYMCTSCSSPAFMFVSLLNLSHYNWCEKLSWWRVNFISLMTIELIFMNLLQFVYFLLQSFLYIYLGLFGTLSISRKVLFILWLQMYCCSVNNSSVTLWNPMDCSMPDFFVLHYPPGFAQIHVHWVGDAI